MALRSFVRKSATDVGVGVAKSLRDSKGRWAGSIGSGARNIPTARSGADRARAQREALERLREVGGVIDPVETDSVYDLFRSKTGPTLHDDRGDSRSHPVYGGRNWGVSYSDHWDDYTVNHGYYGAIDRRDDGTFIDYSDVPLADHETRWACDQKTKEAAITMWQHREFVTAGLHAQGLTPRGSVRVRGEISDDAITVSPYDRATDFEPFTIPRLR